MSSPFCAIPSISTSFAPSMNFEMTTGEERGEFMAILGTINLWRRGAQNADTGARERKCERIRRLPAYRDDDAARHFKIADVTNALKGKLFEIQAVGYVIIDRLYFEE